MASPYQMVALADAIPAGKYSWRPAPGVRTVSEVFMRVIVHANEHMGQMIAYARTMGVAPPWSKNAAE